MAQRGKSSQYNGVFNVVPVDELVGISSVGKLHDDVGQVPPVRSRLPRDVLDPLIHEAGHDLPHHPELKENLIHELTYRALINKAY